MTRRALQLRRRIFEAFAATGAPPALRPSDASPLGELERAHVVVMRDERVHMAHPFAGHRQGARVEARGTAWWGNCGWDALGIVAALGLSEARVIDRNGVIVTVEGGRALGNACFSVEVPARSWWADIEFT